MEEIKAFCSHTPARPRSGELTCWQAAAAVERGGAPDPAVVGAWLHHALFPTCPESNKTHFFTGNKELRSCEPNLRGAPVSCFHETNQYNIALFDIVFIILQFHNIKIHNVAIIVQLAPARHRRSLCFNSEMKGIVKMQQEPNEWMER